MNIEDIHENMRVIYIPNHAEDRNHHDCEHGIVSSKNEATVFVKFDKHLNLHGWTGTTSQGCYPHNLVKETK